MSLMRDFPSKSQSKLKELIYTWNDCSCGVWVIQIPFNFDHEIICIYVKKWEMDNILNVTSTEL